jgi:hypothetical protein
MTTETPARGREELPTPLNPTGEHEPSKGSRNNREGGKNWELTVHGSLLSTKNRPNAGLSRREAVGFVPLVLPERSGGKGHRLSPAFSMSEAKGERIADKLRAP